MIDASVPKAADALKTAKGRASALWPGAGIVASIIE